MAETSFNAPGLSTETGASEQSVADTLRTGGQTGGQTGGRAGAQQAIEEAKSKVREAAESQRQRAAEAVGGMAGALHRAASDLTAENETMGRYTNLAAERLDEVAQYLRSTNWNQVVEGAEDFARRQPYWFVGGAMAAGFVLARIIKNAGEPGPRADVSSRLGQRVAASSAAGYGTSTEAGPYPPTTATTQPISSAPVSSGSTISPGGEA